MRGEGFVGGGVVVVDSIGGALRGDQPADRGKTGRARSRRAGLSTGDARDDQGEQRTRCYPSRLRACPLPANLEATKPRQAGLVRKGSTASAGVIMHPTQMNTL